MGHKVPARTTTQLVSLASVTIELITRRMRKKRSNPSARAQMNTNVTLSSHYLIWSDSGLGRGFDLLCCV
uniref:Uncharacterized protein n=1 Tax=Zea mays TaxID=4577 RepID=C0PLA5_MAIZE|nr:unknown [Zea mays]